jgi:transposase
MRALKTTFRLWGSFGDDCLHRHPTRILIEKHSFLLSPWRLWFTVTLLTRLLADAALLHLNAWQLDDTATQLTLRVTSVQALVHCPVCRFPTRRIHSRYSRTVADRPWGLWRVVLHLQVRKFFCANGRCPRRLFTERLTPLVAPWARRTQRLVHWLVHIAVALAGRAGARLSCTLGLAVSRRTLLRLLRRLPSPHVATPHVLGVDDWAYRQRQT